MGNNNLELLDIITLISFAMQLQNAEQLRKQATNNDVINDIHQDIMQLDAKLDRILEQLSPNSGNKRI